MNIQTGDIMHIGPASWKDASLFQKGILTHGSLGTHDAPLKVDRYGVIWEACAHTPHFEYLPFEDRLKACSGMNPTSRMVILRHRHWVECDDYEAYLRWQGQAASVMNSMARLKLPYDKIGITSFGRNVLRETMGISRRVWKQVEHHVWCTEGTQHVYSVVECYPIDIFAGIDEQPMYAPIHVERAIAVGNLLPVMDFGMMKWLQVKQAGR